MGAGHFYQKGDKFAVERQEIPLSKIHIKSNLCIHSICGLYGVIMQVRGGIFKSIYAQYLDPGSPYSDNGGTVIFEVRQGERLE